MKSALRLAFLLIAAFLCTFRANTTAEDLQKIDGGSWIGIFNQQTPLRWRGKMILVFEVVLSDESPWPLRGIVSWPDLGGAQSLVIGRRTGDKAEFVEQRCLKNCGRIITGGRYYGKFNSDASEFRGRAEIKDQNFSGTFILRRIVLPENSTR